MEKPQDRKNLKTIAKFSGLATEMAVLMLAGTFGGQYLDKRLETQQPWFTIGLILFALFISLYQLFKKLAD